MAPRNWVTDLAGGEIRNDRDPWNLELTEAQYERLPVVAECHGISGNDYIRFTIQGHAQELIENDARQRAGTQDREASRILDFHEKGFEPGRCITVRNAANQTFQST